MQIDISLDKIIEFLSDELINVYGDPESIIVKHLRDPEYVDEFTLDWVNPIKQEKQKIAKHQEQKPLLLTKRLFIRNY